MSNFYGKIKVYQIGGKFKLRVVTQLDNGEETTDFCSFEEIERAIELARSGKSRKQDEQEFGLGEYTVYVSDEV